MRYFKMIVAVMFAVMAVMLMSTNVFAEKDYIQNITVDNNGVFTWDEYEGAVRYSLSLYGRESDTDDGTGEYIKLLKNLPLMQKHGFGNLIYQAENIALVSLLKIQTEIRFQSIHYQIPIDMVTVIISTPTKTGVYLNQPICILMDNI